MGLTGHEMPDSDSEAVYEFTQDAQRGDLRDPQSRRRRSLGLDVEPNSVLAFWRLICDTFRKIVDSKYTTGISGFLLCWAGEVQSSIRQLKNSYKK